MANKKFLNWLYFVLLIPLGITISHILSYHPTIVERVYSNTFDKFIRELLSSLFGLFPFSLFEIVILLAVLITLSYITYTITMIIKRDNTVPAALANFIYNISVTISIIYFCFLVVWGFNYQRLPFSSIARLNVKPSSINELTELCESLINRCNSLRSKINENGNGTMYFQGGIKNIFLEAPNGYKAASELYPELGGSYGRSKPVHFSKMMSYAGISGIYFPFTGEPNVNTDIPASMLPNTTCHEMAHQHGFAREDEANYISYLVCNMNADIRFQYSGTLLAMINSVNALAAYNPQLYSNVIKKCSPAVVRDLKELNSFWDRYRGPVQKISDNINNAYLKANMQKDGINSYGRMVDLLLAERRKQINR